VSCAALRTIVVDLTPVLPGGENGGAKLFALELVRRLSAAHPATHFILLTQAVSHEELATLDRDNVRRVLVVGTATSALRSRLFGAAARMLADVPAPLRRIAARLGYAAHAFLKRGGASRLLGEMNADLLFCPFTAPTYQEAGIPTVCTIYDLQYRAYPQFFSIEDAMQRDRAFRDACRRATLLAAISAYSRDAAISHGPLDPARIRAIPLRMGRDVPPVTAADRDLDRFGLRSGRYLLYPANFWKHKNHEMLLTAFAIACREGLDEDVKLVCTGERGARGSWLQEAARRMDLGGRVVFPGFLPGDELHALMAHARALVFPSLHEGFGLPVVEAMAAGVPVACSNVTALPEVAGDAALLFDPRAPAEIAHAIVALTTDEALRARLTAEGKRRAAEFCDPDRMAREYWEVFLDARPRETSTA
jgi:glycosyltransferase involved in cell wall biosynthesis